MANTTWLYAYTVAAALAGGETGRGEDAILDKEPLAPTTLLKIAAPSNLLDSTVSPGSTLLGSSHSSSLQPGGAQVHTQINSSAESPPGSLDSLSLDPQSAEGSVAQAPLSPSQAELARKIFADAPPDERQRLAETFPTLYRDVAEVLALGTSPTGSQQEFETARQPAQMGKLLEFRKK